MTWFYLSFYNFINFYSIMTCFPFNCYGIPLFEYTIIYATILIMKTFISHFLLLQCCNECIWANVQVSLQYTLKSRNAGQKHFQLYHVQPIFFSKCCTNYWHFSHPRVWNLPFSPHPQLYLALLDFSVSIW